jgi:predicted nucleic-acid-binding protein
MTTELEIIRTFWPIIAFIAANAIAFTVWLLKQTSAIRAEKQARIAADQRIEERIIANHDHHKEKSEIMARAMDEMRKTQNDMLATLHNVELGVTAIREYRKGQEDAHRGRK